MPSVNDTVSQLMSVFPGAWRDYRRSTEYDPDLPYVALGELAHHLVRLMRANESAQFERFFGVVEETLIEAAADIRELLIVRFLEDLQNISLNTAIPLSSWEQWLEPATLEGWRVLIRMWNSALAPGQFNDFIERGVIPAPQTS